VLHVTDSVDGLVTIDMAVPEYMDDGAERSDLMVQSG
jgi:hypothetical protein